LISYFTKLCALGALDDLPEGVVLDFGLLFEFIMGEYAWENVKKIGKE
jgi:hypothetical protein